MHDFLPNSFEGKNKDVHYTWVVLILYLYNCFKFFYLYLCIKSVTLESNNDTCVQNNTLEYNNRFCF